MNIQLLLSLTLILVHHRSSCSLSPSSPSSPSSSSSSSSSSPLISNSSHSSGINDSITSTSNDNLTDEEPAEEATESPTDSVPLEERLSAEPDEGNSSTESEPLLSLLNFLKETVSQALKTAMPTIVQGGMEANVSAKCTNSFLHVMQGLQEGKDWAFRSKY